jgi:hypothetical protein
MLPALLLCIHTPAALHSALLSLTVSALFITRSCSVAHTWCLQGVAASVLAYADTTEEVQYLAAVCTPPAVMLCLSPSNYTSQAATRLLYNIARLVMHSAITSASVPM